jgi:hypothetical protein
MDRIATEDYEGLAEFIRALKMATKPEG